MRIVIANKFVTVNALGVGQGAGKEIIVLRRDIIEKIIDNLDLNTVFKLAYSAWNRNSKIGCCELNLQTGEAESIGFSVGECNQACDNHVITLYSINSLAEIQQFGDCGCDYEGSDKCKCECLVDEDGEPYNVEDFIIFEEMRFSAMQQLDEWYCEENKNPS